ncbi:Aste57867_22936 [Aphanomyces stellatus]|uniref:Aste57867_22936 protein n=1 Tax=Aphanomyces stellatus TaxID=120398 RepID=A0A485LLC0_9STRA|nr:hypothetical protein As57867_022865 [Aphanomyces stellatus]VFT99586.1 Aste57867_22936 [Aphanomyces stellatus]
MPEGYKAKLDATGFVWNANAHQWEINVLALETYKSHFGHLCVPKEFVIQDQDPAWPKSTWKLNLGSIVRRLRQSKKTMPSEKYELLEAMGYVWRLRDRGQDPRPPRSIPLYHQQRILELDQFIHTNVQGHVKFTNFPKWKFKVHDPWPEHWRGITLDISVFRRAYKHGILDPLIVAELDKIGFVWNFLEHQRQLNIEALQLYKEKVGDLLIERKYVVPDKDPTWPVYLWKKKLSVVVPNIRAHKNSMGSERRNVLSAMGFVWDADEDARLLNLEALEIYKSLFGNVLVPFDFNVPQTDEWPEALWDKKLGRVVVTL